MVNNDNNHAEANRKVIRSRSAFGGAEVLFQVVEKMGYDMNLMIYCICVCICQDEYQNIKQFDVFLLKYQFV